MITTRSAGVAFVVITKDPCGRRYITRSQVSIANRRDHQVSDQCIGVGQCLLDAAPISAVSDVEFGSYFLLGQDEQTISTDWFMENR